MIIEALKTGIRVKIDGVTVVFDAEAADADIFLLSDPAAASKRFSFASPGEVEVKGVFVFGVGIDGKVGYALRTRDWRFGYLPFPIKKLDGETKNRFMEADGIYTVPENAEFVRDDLGARHVIVRTDEQRAQKISRALDTKIATVDRVNMKTVETSLINLSS